MFCDPYNFLETRLKSKAASNFSDDRKSALTLALDLSNHLNNFISSMSRGMLDKSIEETIFESKLKVFNF